MITHIRDRSFIMINHQLDGIIKDSTFTVAEGGFVYAKVSEIPKTERHFMITQDADEITVVTTEDRLSECALIERNKDTYRLIALNVSIPFYSVGLLATVSEAIAKEAMDILVVSTYSKDYILVKEDKIQDAIRVLSALGFKERSI